MVCFLPRGSLPSLYRSLYLKPAIRVNGVRFKIRCIALLLILYGYKYYLKIRRIYSFQTRRWLRVRVKYGKWD
ncbi:MAG: hypothetical protein DJ555_05095 [Desulfurococcaceae archaeon]|nr:MAG: hypothetical protein DJ555_05095 [Desulfurococcaceae archaeon]